MSDDIVKDVMVADGSNCSFGPGYSVTEILIDGILQSSGCYSQGSGVVTFFKPPKKGARITFIAAGELDAFSKLGPEKANRILTEYLDNVKLREEYPSIEKAWQQYQAVIKLTKG